MKLRSIVLGSLLGCFAAFCLNLALQHWPVRQVASPDRLTPLAEQGIAEAQYVLGMTLITVDEAAEEGAAPDYEQAAPWIRRAAQQGLPSAQYQLGLMYAEGLGVPKDSAQAAEWYLRAAEQAHGGAQHGLAAIYSDGRGLHQDFVMAHKWINLAAAAAKGETGEEYVRLRDAIAAQMSPDQVSDAQRLAREWRPKAWAELSSPR